MGSDNNSYIIFVFWDFIWYIYDIMKTHKSLLFILTVSILVLLSYEAFAGKLFIKPKLELKRATRLIREAENDFRTGKIHIALSPELSIHEFTSAMNKYEDIVVIIDKYGAGTYSPGALEDFEDKIEECEDWIKKAKRTMSRKGIF
jgi:hypothetical protein